MRLDRLKLESMAKRLDDAVDLWMAIEHHRIWERKNELKEAREAEEETYVDLTAPDMASMLEKMKRLAGMERRGGEG